MLFVAFHANANFSFLRCFTSAGSASCSLIYCRAPSRYSSGIVGGKGDIVKIHLLPRGRRSRARAVVVVSSTSLPVCVRILFGASNCAQVIIMTLWMGIRVSLATCSIMALRQIWSLSDRTTSWLIGCESICASLSYLLYSLISSALFKNPSFLRASLICCDTSARSSSLIDSSIGGLFRIAASVIVGAGCFCR